MNPIKNYIKNHNVPINELSSYCDVGVIHLYAVIGDRKRPSIDLISKIVKFSDGAVTIDEIVKHYVETPLSPVV